MRVGRTVQTIPVLVVALAVWLTGCTHHADVVRVTSTDLRALNNIYDSSPAVFHGTQIDVQVQPGGTVEVGMRGQVTPKRTPPDFEGVEGTPQTPEPNASEFPRTSKSDTLRPASREATASQRSRDPVTRIQSDIDATPMGIEGDIWIPVLLTGKLPPYFQLVAPSDLSRISLEAYELKGGLWCIAAVVKQGQASGFRSSKDSERPPQLLDFRIALASKPFSQALPFVIPAGQTGEPVAISVNLPNGSRLTSSDTALTMRSVPGWRESGNFTGTISTISESLTRVPPALANNSVRAAATVYSPDAVGWDFSEVKFTQPGFFSQYRSWFVPSVVLFALCAIGLGLILSPLATVNSTLRNLSENERMQALSVRQATVDLTREAAGVFEGIEPHEVAELGKTLEQISIGIGQIRNYRDFVQLDTVRELRSNVKQLLSRGKPGANFPNPNDSVHRLLWQLADLESSFEAVERSWRRISHVQQTRRKITTALWVLGTSAFICIVLIMAILARAQSNRPLPRSRSIPAAMLCDLYITLTPHDSQGKIADRVDVALRFSPLSGVRSQKTSKVQIGPGDLPFINIDDPVTPTDKNLAVLQHSSRLITLSFPTAYSSILTRLDALSEFVKEVVVPDDYPQALASTNQLNFTYTLQGAEVQHTRSSMGRHWLYLFPFDSVDVDIPLDVRQASLLSHLELQKPAVDYFADVSVDGLPISLAESENGDKYDFALPKSNARTQWTSGGKVVVHGKFQRTAFQRWGLTFGVWVLSIIVGAIAGWSTTLPDKSWIGYVITLLGATGLVFGVRTAVLSTYKELPTLITGQGTTVFELFFVASLIFMVLTIWFARKAING